MAMTLVATCMGKDQPPGRPTATLPEPPAEAQDE